MARNVTIISILPACASRETAETEPAVRRAVILQICHLVRKRYLFLLNLAELGTDRINLVHLLFMMDLKISFNLASVTSETSSSMLIGSSYSATLRRNGRLLKKDTLRIHLAVTQLVCHTFVHLVLQKLLYQFRTRILFFLRPPSPEPEEACGI